MRYLSIGLFLTLAYDGCALFLEGRLLKRGALGTVVATPGFWRPLPLIAEVGGDSAIRYARSFERNAFRGKVTGAAGGLLVVGGLFLTRPARSQGGNDFARLETGAGMTLSGLVLVVQSPRRERRGARTLVEQLTLQPSVTAQLSLSLRLDSAVFRKIKEHVSTTSLRDSLDAESQRRVLELVKWLRNRCPA